MAAHDPKQVIVEWLSNPTSIRADMSRKRGHLAEASTIQFLKECSLPRLQLHTVCYKSTTGKRRNEVCLVERDTADLWQVKESSGHTLDDPIAIAYRDRKRNTGQPWVLLSETISRDSSPFSFWAHGEVIDNGFGVARVRLMSSNGHVLEDTVQEGLVLFLTDLPFEYPVEVELYSHADKLVGRQNYPDFQATQ